VLFGAAASQKSMQPLFPPASIKSYNSGHGSNDYFNGGIYGGGMVPGKVSFGGLGDLGGNAGILGGPDSIRNSGRLNNLDSIYPGDHFSQKGWY